MPCWHPKSQEETKSPEMLGFFITYLVKTTSQLFQCQGNRDAWIFASSLAAPECCIFLPPAVPCHSLSLWALPLKSHWRTSVFNHANGSSSAWALYLCRYEFPRNWQRRRKKREGRKALVSCPLLPCHNSDTIPVFRAMEPMTTCPFEGFGETPHHYFGTIVLACEWHHAFLMGKAKWENCVWQNRVQVAMFLGSWWIFHHGFRRAF